MRKGWTASFPSARAKPARARRVGSLVLLLALLFASLPAVAAPPASAPPVGETPLAFGVLPLGGPAESQDAWKPMLDDMGRTLKRPIRSVSVSTYEGLAHALAEERIDVAFVSGKLALTAVTHDHMQVIAQLIGSNGSHGYYAVLLVAKDSPLRSVDALLHQPGRWRYARGEPLSVSGYLVPEMQVFAMHQLDSDTFFASVAVDNHQNNALAVANGEADVATNNTADLERFAKRFPDQNARLRTLWQSSLIPHAVIIARNDLPAEFRERLAAFLTSYGKIGHNAAADMAKLKLIHDISGFAIAGNDMLVPFVDMEYNLERRRALSAQWVNRAALQARLSKISANHQQLLNQLNGTQIRGAQIKSIDKPLSQARDPRP